MGGDSPIRLMRLPGEPARPPLAHSFVMLGAVLADTEVVDKASKSGDAAWLTLYGGTEGRISGVLTAGEDASESRRVFEESLPLPLGLRLELLEDGQRGSRTVMWRDTHANLPAVCLVTAAAIPPLSLAFFLSFLEPETWSVGVRRSGVAPTGGGQGAMASPYVPGIQLVSRAGRAVSCTRGFAFPQNVCVFVCLGNDSGSTREDAGLSCVVEARGASRTSLDRIETSDREVSDWVRDWRGCVALRCVVPPCVASTVLAGRRGAVPKERVDSGTATSGRLENGTRLLGVRNGGSCIVGMSSSVVRSRGFHAMKEEEAGSSGTSAGVGRRVVVVVRG